MLRSVNAMWVQELSSEPSSTQEAEHYSTCLKALALGRGTDDRITGKMNWQIQVQWQSLSQNIMWWRWTEEDPLWWPPHSHVHTHLRVHTHTPAHIRPYLQTYADPEYTRNKDRQTILQLGGHEWSLLEKTKNTMHITNPSGFLLREWVHGYRRIDKR